MADELKKIKSNSGIYSSEEIVYTPFVSIVIPVLNGERYINQCISSLRGQDYSKDHFEVIVVDNGSTDNSVKLLKSLNIPVFFRKERGRSKALNLGVKNAKGEIICTIDISCVAEPDFIENVVLSFNDEHVGCVAGEIKLLTDQNSKIIEFQNRNNYMSPMHAKNRKNIPYLPYADGANASFRKEVFERIGLFDEDFFKAADVEICYRMLILTDYKIVFNEDAIVFEPGEQTLFDLLKQRFRIATGKSILERKYKELFKLSEKYSIKKSYWQFYSVIKSFVKFIEFNLQGVLIKETRTKAYDMNIRYLMLLSEFTGKLYSLFVLQKVISKVRILEKEKIEIFLSKQ